MSRKQRATLQQYIEQVLDAQPKFPKPGIIRLSGKALDELREQCFKDARGRCTKCGRPLKPGWHMAHIRAKRNNGDIIDGKLNVRARCNDCHMIADHNPKSVPSKSGGIDARRLGNS